MMSRSVFVLALVIAAAFSAPVVPSDMVPEEEMSMVQTKQHVKATVLSQAQATNADDFSADSNADFATMIGGAAPQPQTANVESATASADMVDDIPPPVQASTPDEWTRPAGDTEFKYEFQPDFHSLAKPPPVTGSQSAYLSKAGNAKEAQVLAEDKEIAAEEQAAALKQAEADSEKAREVQSLQNEKNEVKTLMNTAAAAAAAYKTAKQFHDLEVKREKEAEAAAAAQMKLVREAEATLAHQKAIYKAKEVLVAKAKDDEMHSRFKAEFKGRQYTKARDAAIKADNDFRQTEHEEAKKQKFREVAEKAVAKEAQREAAEESAEAKEAGDSITAENIDKENEDGSVGAVVKPLPSTPPASEDESEDESEDTDGCSNCVSLPDVYANAGGSCGDCDEWAKKGQCDLDTYKDFMSQYCAKSCGCKLTVKEVTPVLLAMPHKH